MHDNGNYLFLKFYNNRQMAQNNSEGNNITSLLLQSNNKYLFNP